MNRFNFIHSFLLTNFWIFNSWVILVCRRFEADGKFVPILQIGRMLHDTDEYLLSMTGQSPGQQTTSLAGNRSAAYHNFRENVINQLKHRILTFLYRRAAALSERDGNLFELRKFYQFFDQVWFLFLPLFVQVSILFQSIFSSTFCFTQFLL